MESRAEVHASGSHHPEKHQKSIVSALQGPFCGPTALQATSPPDLPSLPLMACGSFEAFEETTLELYRKGSKTYGGSSEQLDYLHLQGCVSSFFSQPMLPVPALIVSVATLG